MPEDLRDYSNITDAISAALSAWLGKGGTADGNGNGTANGDGNSSNTDPNGGSDRKLQGAPPQSIYSKGINSLGTTKASSIPVPLLVLAGLGTLLLISAAGLAAHNASRPARRSRPRSLGPLDLDARQPLEPARQVPVPRAEQLHRRREQHRADDRRVDQQRDRDPEAHLLEHDEVAHGEAGEDGDDDQRRAGDQARGRRDAVDDRVVGRAASAS